MKKLVQHKFLLTILHEDYYNKHLPQLADMLGGRLWSLNGVEKSDCEIMPPIPMLLYCPNCGKQHVDQLEETVDAYIDWSKRPHRSHKCDACQFIWRPSDWDTIGVAEILTKGTDDGPMVREAAPCILDVCTIATGTPMVSITQAEYDELVYLAALWKKEHEL